MARAKLPVAGLILAAGRSTRFGRSKPLEPVDGIPSVHRVANAALCGGLRPIVVVTMADNRRAIQEALAGLPAEVVSAARSPDDCGDTGVAGGHHAGVTATSSRGASLAAGLLALPADIAVAVLLADVPFVTPSCVSRLVATWRASDALVVRVVHAGTLGHPVLFDPALRPLLAEGRPDGGRAAIEAAGKRYLALQVADELEIADFDTPGELTRLLAARRRAER